MAKKKEEPSAKRESADSVVEPAEAPAATRRRRKTKDKVVSKGARQWAMFCHLAGLAWMIAWLAPIIGGVLGTLIIWQVKKDDDPYIDEHGKRAFNFQLSMLIYAVGLTITFIGVVLVPVVAILDIVFVIIAAIRANDGKDYNYPLSIRFVK